VALNAATSVDSRQVNRLVRLPQRAANLKIRLNPAFNPASWLNTGLSRRPRLAVVCITVLPMEHRIIPCQRRQAMDRPTEVEAWRALETLWAELEVINQSVGGQFV